VTIFKDSWSRVSIQDDKFSQFRNANSDVFFKKQKQLSVQPVIIMMYTTRYHNDLTQKGTEADKNKPNILLNI